MTPTLSQPAPAQTRLANLMSKDYAAKLEAARANQSMRGERRIVTMLFCDVKGSTAAAEKLDPEDWAIIINEAFEYMITPVYRYEGLVARLMGDAILAFFGAPIAHEDDPKRAVLAGLDIIEGFQVYQEKIVQEWGLELNARVGINTGLVMAGAVGSDMQMEYTALGDAINLAARMEQTAAPGTVHVAEDTYRLAAPYFEWEDLGETLVKGKDKPIRTYRPITEITAPARRRGIDGLTTTMVGRQAELDRLRSAADQLAGGNGHIVFVIGEAGLGKSRLISEFKSRHIANARWFESASLSYETTQPYALVQRLIRNVYEVKDNDNPEAVWEKYLPAVKKIPADLMDQGQVFEALFAVRGSTGESQVDGEKFRRQLFDLMTSIVEDWVENSPVLIILEDMHWADQASCELIGHLFRLTTRLPLFILCALRPDQESPCWPLKEAAETRFADRYDEIALRPLSDTEIQVLIRNLLDIPNLPKHLQLEILSKTDGNPLFIEEVVRTLIENGAVRQISANGKSLWEFVGDMGKLEIPGSLQTLLVARIDRLRETARRTLQLASVIGRSFFMRVLESTNEAVSAVESELEKELDVLERTEMIQQTMQIPELEYAFRHALTQEAAYSTILRSQRRLYHLRVGEAIENLYVDRLDEFSPILAHHFFMARDRRAITYGTKAGDAAFRIFAIPEAANHYSNALEIAKSSRKSGRADSAADAETLSHLYIRQGRCYELLAKYPEALQNYDEMLSWAESIENPEQILLAKITLATVLAFPNSVQDADRAKIVADEALELAGKVNDRAAEARLYWVLMLVIMYAGDMPAGLPYGVRAADLARELGLTELLASALQDVGLAFTSTGDLEKGEAALTEARPLWESLQNLPMLAENYANSVYYRLSAGDFDEAVRLSEKAFQIGQAIENQWSMANAHVFVTSVHIARGEVDQAIQTGEKMIAFADKVGHPARIIAIHQLSTLFFYLGAFDDATETANRCYHLALNFPPFLPLGQSTLARQAIRNGDFALAEQLLSEASSTIRRTTLQLIDVMVDFISAELHLGRREPEQAQEMLDILFNKLDRSRAAFFFPDLFMHQAEVHRMRGDQEAAISALADAREIAERIGHKITLWKILAGMGEMEHGQKLAASIADNISDTRLRSTFESFYKSVLKLTQ